ncbi:MAG: ABC transporter permease subunit [Albidovulum sp.]
MAGCTPWQMFWLVKVPAAKPQLLLGLNQTILYGLSMLVIAAMVGTTGLGQQIFIALGKADPGLGITAGLGMALIAISIDRMLKAAAT